MGIIWEKERLQEEWKLNIMCPIHKKEDRSNCRTTEACCYYTTIPNNKLEPYIKKEYQAGFGQGRSTIDQISTAKQILQNCREYNINVYLALTDFRQAYDSVRSEKMYEVLQHFQIPNKLIRLVKATMDNMLAKVQVQTHMSNSTELEMI